MSITLEEVVDILSDAEIPGGDDERVVVSVDNGGIKYYSDIDEMLVDKFNKLEESQNSAGEEE